MLQRNNCFQKLSSKLGLLKLKDKYKTHFNSLSKTCVTVYAYYSVGAVNAGQI